MSTILDGMAPIRREGTASAKPLAFRHETGLAAWTLAPTACGWLRR
jgi:hypothetical protein